MCEHTSRVCVCSLYSHLTETTFRLFLSVHVFKFVLVGPEIVLSRESPPAISPPGDQEGPEIRELWVALADRWSLPPSSVSLVQIDL